MKVETRFRKRYVVLTMREAVILKRAAWDGPDPNDAEQRILDRVLEGIEKAQNS